MLWLYVMDFVMDVMDMMGGGLYWRASMTDMQLHCGSNWVMHLYYNPISVRVEIKELDNISLGLNIRIQWWMKQKLKTPLDMVSFKRSSLPFCQFDIDLSHSWITSSWQLHSLWQYWCVNASNVIVIWSFHSIHIRTEMAMQWINSPSIMKLQMASVFMLSRIIAILWLYSQRCII